MIILLDHPDQWDLLKNDPEGMTVSATEDGLRYDSSVKSITRIADEDDVLIGDEIRLPIKAG